jgi:hypothetical protein
MPERLTRRNPNHTYRIPMADQKTIRLEWQQGSLNVFGELADRLGQYEDLGTVEELMELKRTTKK